MSTITLPSPEGHVQESQRFHRYDGRRDWEEDARHAWGDITIQRLPYSQGYAAVAVRSGAVVGRFRNDSCGWVA